MKSRTTGSIIAIACLAVGALVLACFRSVAVEAVYPIENAARTAGSGLWARLSGVFRGTSVGVENARLRREVAALSLLKGDVERLETENARLRRALDYTARTPEVWLAASVLSVGGGASGARDILRVGKGALAGVREGAVVVVPEGVVGRVTQVTPHTSEVTLVSDPSVKVACEIESKSNVRAFGILSGGSDGFLVLRHLRGAETVSPQARVLTSGLGGVFPPGLEVGTLLDVRKDSRGLVCEGEVLPKVDCSTLEDVFIRRER